MNLLPMYQKCFELFWYVYCITNRLDCTISSQILLHCDTKLYTMCLLTQSNNRTCLIKTEYNFFGPLSHIQAHLTNHNDLTWKYLPGAYFCQGRRSRGVCVVVVVGRTFFPPFKTNDCAFFSSLTKNYRFKVFLEFFGRLSFV